MNARQKAKKLKKQIKALKSDNDLMCRIIADTPAMQELYAAYKKPMFVTHTTMQFQEYRLRRMIPVYMLNIDGLLEREKQAVAMDLFEEIKDNIIYDVDDKDMKAIITASIFIGRR